VLQNLCEIQNERSWYEQPSSPYFGKYERDVTDKMKKEYCNSHGIILCEIRYDEDTISSLKKLIATYVNSVPSSA